MTYKYPSTVIQVFCKAPVPGQVKTRLTPELSDIQAAEVHRQLSIQSINLVSAFTLCPVQLWCSPNISHSFFKEMSLKFSVPLLPQSSGNLGQRMHNAICQGTKGYKHILLLGCDCPSLTTDDILDAIRALHANNDIVLAPAEDGGYCLIGMNTPHAELFTDINWGKSEVLKQTREKIKHLKLNSHEVKTQWDVDYYTDYQRYLNSCDISSKE